MHRTASDCPPHTPPRPLASNVPAAGRRLAAALAALLLAVALPAVAAAEPWRQYADPEEVGFSSEALAAAHAYAQQIGTGAAMAVYRGAVVAAWGDVERPFKCASMRKSFLSALYGIHAEAGRIDLDATLAELGVDDLGGLTQTEKKARVIDLMRSRSGIYHRAAYEPPDMASSRPERGSQPPGESFFYNNWDFNALGTILEQAIGRDLFTDFHQRIAEPIGMEDFDLGDTFSWIEPSRTLHRAYLFRMSVRDRARFGQLFLDQGRWGERQVVPASWIERSTSVATRFSDGNGYGLMWWVYPPQPDAPSALARLGSFMASGSGGQKIIVVPGADFVFAHAADTDSGDGASATRAIELAAKVLDARIGEPAAPADPVNARLTALESLALEGVAPPPAPRIARRLPAEVIDRLLGEYGFGPGGKLVLHLHQGRLYANPIGPPFPEIELFAESEERLYSAEGNLEVEVKWSAEGEVDELVVRRPDTEWTLTPLAPSADAGPGL